MDDIYFFTPASITLDDLAGALPGGFRVLHGSPAGLVVGTQANESFRCHWAPMAEVDFDPDDWSQLDDEVRAVFCCSRHPSHDELLVPILQALLTAFGGWIGSDEPGFEPRFDVSGIGALPSADMGK